MQQYNLKCKKLIKQLVSAFGARVVAAGANERMNGSVYHASYFFWVPATIS